MVLTYRCQPALRAILTTQHCCQTMCVQAGNCGHGKCGLPVVGFCFSFAVEQASLDSGKLLVWSKGFTVDGVIGKDVVQLLSGTLTYVCWCTCTTVPACRPMC